MLDGDVPWPEPVPAPVHVVFVNLAVRSAHVRVERAGRINVSSRHRPFYVESACDCGKRVYGAYRDRMR